jgi:hypothetical protein
MAWLQQQSTRERPDTFTQLSPSSCPRTLHGRGGPYIFCSDFLHNLDLEITLGYQLLEPPAGCHPFSQLPMEGYFFSRSPAPADSTQYFFSHSSLLKTLGTRM